MKLNRAVVVSPQDISNDVITMNSIVCLEDIDTKGIVQQWAKLSLDASPFAQAYYRSVRPHCQTDNDALRRLGNRWLEVLWRLWQDHQSYDEVYHLKQRTSRSIPR